MNTERAVAEAGRPVSAHAVLVCKTTPAGVITYVNQDLAAATGHAADELRGSQHARLRHPDMPPAVFEDMERTLNAGRPWVGLIKQRHKNGEVQWLDASVSPLVEEGRATEYLWVCHAADPDQIQRAEARHARIRAGKERAREDGWLTRLNPLPRLRLGYQLVLLMVALVLPFCFQLWSYWEVESVLIQQMRTEQLGDPILKPLRQFAGLLNDHRRQSSRLINGDKNQEAGLQASRVAMDNLLAELTANHAQTLEAWALGPGLEELRKDWDSLKQGFQTLSARENFTAHSTLIENVLDFMLAVGNKSQLRFDPDQNTYLVVVALLEALPGVAESVGDLHGRGVFVLDSGIVEEDDLLELVSNSKFLAHHLEFLEFNLKAFIDSNPDQFQAMLGKPLADLSESIQGFTNAVQKHLLTGNLARLKEDDFDGKGDKILAKAKALGEILSARLAESLDTRVDRAYFTLTLHTGLALAGMLVALMIGVIITRRLTRPMANAIQVFRRMGEGDYSTPVALEQRHDEVGELLVELKKMQIRLGFEVVDAREKASAALRIQQALDSSTSPITVSDGEGRLIFANQAAQRLLRRVEAGLRRRLPEFTADQCLGTPMARLFADPDLVRAYQQPLPEGRTVRVQVADRALDLTVAPVTDDQGTLVGRVTQWTDMTETLAAADREQARIAEERAAAAANLRLKVALDSVSASVMVADADRTIIYLNPRAVSLFGAAEADIRAEMPGFAAHKLLGGPADIFHRGSRAGLQANHPEDLQVGGRTLRRVTNPVLDAAGRPLGTVIEWTDRTTEVAVEREIGAIVATAQTGDLSQRIAAEGKQGFFLQLAEGINPLIEAVDRVTRDMAVSLQALARGDLTQDIRADYQGAFEAIKQDVNDTLGNLRQIVRELRAAADHIAAVADEISGGNNNLSARTEQQASSLEETLASMQQLTEGVRNNAQHAQQARQLASQTCQMAERGGQVVRDAVQAMEAIRQSSRTIGEIIGVIDEIAFQTNLLALNASVEAARAGEQGRGFAVVATEVRNLASRSAAAAREIKGLIQDAANKVQVGADLVHESGATLSGIVASVNQVGNLIADIAEASQDQSTGIDQVNQAVSHMDGMTQQNAALAEEISAASLSMREKAQELKAMVSFFQVPADA